MAYGDELPYLFDACDIFGKALKNVDSLDKTDKKVCDILSNLIIKFANLNRAFQELKSDQSNFIRIGQETIHDKDFR